MAEEGTHGLAKGTGRSLKHHNRSVGMQLQLGQRVPLGELEEHVKNKCVHGLREEALEARNRTLIKG